MATTRPLTLSSPLTATSARAVYMSGAETGSTPSTQAVGNGSSGNGHAPTAAAKPKKTRPNDDLVHTFLTETADDDGNAKCAYVMFGDKFLYAEAWGWMQWTGTHWIRDQSEAVIDRALMAMLKERRLAAVHADKDAIVKATAGTAKRVRDTKTVFRSMIAVDVDAFDQDRDCLNTISGVLNLCTGEVTPHAPTHRFTYCIQIPYEPTADDKPWREFLIANVAGGEELLDYLQMAVGYTLTGHTSEECLWYIYGPSRSGKGTFTEVLLSLLGSPLGIEVDFATFTSKREGDTQNFDLAPLKPTRLVVTSESNRFETLNAGKIKQLTGGNYIRAALKHRDHFTFQPQFKPWLVSNQPVNADVDDDALWYRVKVLEFPTSHVGEEDKGLKPRMKAKENLQGVLRWAVEGAMKWYASPNGLKHPACVSQATQRHRDEIDFIAMWLSEDTVTDPEYWVSNDMAYQSYKHWCIRGGVSPKQLRGFLRALRGKSIQTDVLKRDGERVHKGLKGLRIVADDVTM